MGQDDLDVQISGQSSLTLLGLGSQSDDVCDLFGDRSGIQSPYSKDIANDSVLISFWQVRAADDHAGEEHARVRAILSWICLFLLHDGGIDPFGLDHRLIQQCFRCGVIIGEVDCSCNDVGDILE